MTDDEETRLAALDALGGTRCYVAPTGARAWLRDDKLHRETGPAIVRPNGTREWFLDGKPHREDGPAVERSEGTCEWWLRGTRQWLLDRTHRYDGPAIVTPDGRSDDE